MSSGISTEIAGRVGRLWIDRPGKRNALSEAMWRAIPPALDALQGRGAQIICVTGRGDHFSGGADIGEFAVIYGTPERTAVYNAAVKAGVEAVAACPLPTLAVIRGVCVGGGMSVALACDLRFAAETARFAITPAKLGLVYNFGDTRRLVTAVGAARAKDILFTGRMLDAREAHAIGLIDHVHPEGVLDAAVATHVEMILANSGTSVRDIKRMIGAIAAGADQETSSLHALFSESFASADFAEGYVAFNAKRPPRFSSR